MMTLDQIKDALSDRNCTAVAKATGLHWNTVRAIKNGVERDPSYSTIKTLSDYLTQQHLKAFPNDKA